MYTWHRTMSMFFEFRPIVYINSSGESSFIRLVALGSRSELGSATWKGVHHVLSPIMNQNMILINQLIQIIHKNSIFF